MIVYFSYVCKFIFVFVNLFISLSKDHRLLEKLFSIFILFLLSFFIHKSYYSDFSQYIIWVRNFQSSHHDFIYTNLMYYIGLLFEPEVGLRVFLFTFYSFIILFLCKYNTILFVSCPLIIDCIFPSASPWYS